MNAFAMTTVFVSFHRIYASFFVHFSLIRCEAAFVCIRSSTSSFCWTKDFIWWVKRNERKRSATEHSTFMDCDTRVFGHERRDIRTHMRSIVLPMTTSFTTNVSALLCVFIFKWQIFFLCEYIFLFNLLFGQRKKRNGFRIVDIDTSGKSSATEIVCNWHEWNEECTSVVPISISVHRPFSAQSNEVDQTTAFPVHRFFFHFLFVAEDHDSPAKNGNRFSKRINSISFSFDRRLFKITE